LVDLFECVKMHGPTNPKYITLGNHLLVITTNKNSTRFNRCVMINITNCALHDKATRTMRHAQTAEGCHNILCIQEDSGRPERSQSVSKWKEIIPKKIRSESGKWILICGYFVGKNS
jgi:hypothetical protein